TLQSAGLGVASIRDLATSIPVNIVSVPPGAVAKLGPPYVSATIPAGTYNGQTSDVPTMAIVNFLVTHDGVPEETVYQMTKQLFENLDQMVAAHKAASAIKLEQATAGMPVPLHPGAARYYKEKGLIK
ncbi:MAG TPA: TAXI family TRAP transporter solute-binding subunit, partial [Rubrivivax sp.]|nr:TAXI family TRAP transporter solute-binding subunit [Rubrivivax sp.]